MSIAGAIEPARRAEIEHAVEGFGGSITWRTHGVGNRTYASISAPSPLIAADIPTAPGDRVFEGAIIALAVFPTVPEALPVVVEALSGPGRPASVLACHPVPGGVVVEWDPQGAPIEVLLGIIDVELRRFNSARTAELLAPLPPDVVAAVAARGLQTPQITTRRILELIVDR